MSQCFAGSILIPLAIHMDALHVILNFNFFPIIVLLFSVWDVYAHFLSSLNALKIMRGVMEYPWVISKFTCLLIK